MPGQCNPGNVGSPSRRTAADCLVQEGSPDRKPVRAGAALHARRVQCVKDGIEGKDPPLINNRQAGRRNRGRNNGRQNGGNRGGDNGNRIDSRARGNAPQLLEKYRNLARDAQLAGDRVNTEYYLQFADHYFRVIADNRSRQEEQQSRYRRNDEALDYDAGDGEGLGDDLAVASLPGDIDDIGNEGDDRRARNAGRQDRARPPRPDRADNRQRPDAEDDGEERGEERGDRRRPRRAEKIVIARRSEAGEEKREDAVEAPAAAPEAPAVAEAEEAAPKRATRARKPRQSKAEDDLPGLDLAVLPPAISRADNDDGADAGDEGGEEKPAPRRRGRRPKAAEAAE